MDQTLHRSRAHQRVETDLGQVLPQCVGERGFDLFLSELAFQLQQEFVDHTQDDRRIQRPETDDGIQPVAELRREQAFDVGHLVALLARIQETDARLVHRLGTGIGGHDDDDVAEIGFAAVVVGQGAMVHDLQQHVEHIRMSFLNFVEQQHAMRLFAHGLGQQTALVKAHVAGRRAYQTTHRVTLHVLAHVEANELYAQHVSELLGHFGFAHAGWAGEQE